MKYFNNLSNEQQVEKIYYNNLSKKEPIETTHSGNLLIKELVQTNKGLIVDHSTETKTSSTRR
jgi:hypothetical protein